MPVKRRRAPTNPIESANRKTDEDFIRDHLQQPRFVQHTFITVMDDTLTFQ